MPKIYDNLLIIGGQNQIPLIVYTQSTSNPVLYVGENGNVGIGLTPSYYRLEVSGTVSTVGLRMPTGASAGYIIKSDTLGNASWQRSEYDTMPDVDDKTIEISLSNEIRLKQTVDVAYNSVGNIVARHFNGAIEQGYNTKATGTSSHASGYGSTASGITSFIHSYNSSVSGDRSVVLGGQNINGTQSDTVYVPNINIVNISTVSTSDNLLVRLPDGMIKSISPSQLISNMSGVTGSGTTNYISKFTSSSSIGNSLIFDDGTGVGIGTTSPNSKLDIETSTGYGLVTKITGSGGVALTARSDDSGSTPFICQAGSKNLMTVLYDGKISIGAGLSPSSLVHIKSLNNSFSTSSLRVENSSNNTLLFVRDDGFVGIGATGSLWLDSKFRISTSATGYQPMMMLDSTSTGAMVELAILADPAASNRKGITIGYQGSTSNFPNYGAPNTGYIYSTTGTDGLNFTGSGYWRFGPLGAFSYLMISAAGNVGIGTNSPSEKLDVNGKTKTTNLQVNTGSVLSGYVLCSSDSSGNAVWRQVGTSSGIGAVNKYATTISNSSISVNVVIPITHNLGTTDISVSIWDISLNEMTFAKIGNRTTNGVDVTFTSKPVGDIRIVVMA